MKWFIIWICACNPDVQIIYGANTEANVRAYAEALFHLPETNGTYMIAHVSNFYLQQDVCSYDDRKCRPTTVRHLTP